MVSSHPSLALEAPTATLPVVDGPTQLCPTGLALAGGISYDARITPWCSFSPEFFYTWHQVPNGSPYADDVSSIYGLRLNLVWYLQ